MDLMVLAMARKYMDKKVAELISAGWTKEIVKELPTTGNEKTIYMVEQADSAGNIYYDEYMYTNGKFDGIGTTRVELSNYAKKEYVDNKIDSKAEQSQVNSIAEELGNVQTELTNTKNRLSDIEHGKVNVIIFTDTLDSETYEFKNISSKTDVFLINSENIVEESTLLVYYTDGTQEAFIYNGGESLIHFDKSKGISFVIAQSYESLGKVTIQYLVDTKDYVDGELKPTISSILSSTLVRNTEYYLGDISDSITLAFPNDSSYGDYIYINFNAISDITLTIDTSNTSDIDIVPVSSTSYEIFAIWNGFIWILGYNEYTVTTE